MSIDNVNVLDVYLQAIVIFIVLYLFFAFKCRKMKDFKFFKVHTYVFNSKDLFKFKWLFYLLGMIYAYSILVIGVISFLYISRLFFKIYKFLYGK